MGTRTRTVVVRPDSEIGRLLHDALEYGDRLVIDTGEATFQIVIEPIMEATSSIPSRNPTPEEAAASRAAIYEAAGSWKDVDAETFKDYITERRRTANRPSVTW